MITFTSDVGTYRIENAFRLTDLIRKDKSSLHPYSNVKVQKLLVIDKNTFVAVTNRLSAFSFSLMNYNQMTMIKKTQFQDD